MQEKEAGEKPEKKKKKKWESVSSSFLPEPATDGLRPPSAAFSLRSSVSLAPVLLWSLKAPPPPAQSSLAPLHVPPHRGQTNRMCVNDCGGLSSRTRSHDQVSGGQLVKPSPHRALWKEFALKKMSGASKLYAELNV